MSLTVTVVGYLASIVTLFFGGFAAVWIVLSPGPATPKAIAAVPDKFVKLSEPERVPIDSTPFRYGPEINHGRSDTPINAAAQARREAFAMAPSAAVRGSGRKRIVVHPERHSTGGGRHEAAGAPAGYVPSVPSSGH